MRKRDCDLPGHCGVFGGCADCPARDAIGSSKLWNLVQQMLHPRAPKRSTRRDISVTFKAITSSLQADISFTLAWAEGQALNIAEAVAYALESDSAFAE